MPISKQTFDDHVFGRTAETTGERWIAVQQGQTVGWAPRRAFTGNSAEAVAILSHQGIDIIGRDHLGHIHASINALKDFPPGDLVTGVGWNGRHFALQDATVFSPKGSLPFAVVLEPIAGKNDIAGSHEKWLERVATPLARLPLSSFCLMLAFVGPILSLTERDSNFGFELVGGKGRGKSTLQRLTASIFGGIGAGSSGRYLETFDTTLNALEPQLRNHADLLLILDEAALFFAGSSDRQRAAQFQAFAFKMATGDEKGRMNASRARGIRMAYISSSNERLEDIIATKSTTASAAGDRFMTIPVPDDQPHGVFESLPAGYASGSALAQSLISAAGKHHGHAIRVFLEALVDARAADQKGLRKRIKRLVEQFQENVGIDLNSGTDVRVSEAFGLVFAAGRLARDYGALPASFRNLGTAVARVYDMHRQAMAATLPFIERLQEIAEKPETILLSKRRAALTAETLEAAPAFIAMKRDHREALITVEAFVRQFPDHLRLLKQREVGDLMKRDGRNDTCWRALAKGIDKKRVYVFRLPPLEDRNSI
ncbi:DUF927 domain-containing protein [Sphingomonas bacterium]|uniref:DUF927 domain-containing protein n=1 Tax=Sphingomonas bacterium TaxID=1895847 RepID=UPI001576C7C4|nr:DUF927 domain-containing protein [Sphingomonas bacterium]